MRLFSMHHHSNAGDNASKTALSTSCYLAIYPLSRLLCMLLSSLCNCLLWNCSLCNCSLCNCSLCNRSLCNRSLCNRSLCNCCRRYLAKTSSHLLFLTFLVEIYYMLQEDLAIQVESYIVFFFIIVRTTLSRIFANKIKLSS